MLEGPLEALAEADLQDLIERQVREDKYLEYKQEAPSGKHDDVREFLADISSFANAAGGHVLFGVEEQRDTAGRPAFLSGLSGSTRPRRTGRFSVSRA